MTQNITKRDLILDAMQSLLCESTATSISVSDIARKAGIGKGSIYYYFKSKDEILEAVIERSYSKIIDDSKQIISSSDIDAFTKMEIIFHTCRKSSFELQLQESKNYFEIQQSALLHQKYVSFIIKSLTPILSGNISQGIAEGTIRCENPNHAAKLVLMLLTLLFDKHILDEDDYELQNLLDTFASALENCMCIEKGRLDFLRIAESE